MYEQTLIAVSNLKGRHLRKKSTYSFKYWSIQNQNTKHRRSTSEGGALPTPD